MINESMPMVLRLRKVKCTRHRQTITLVSSNANNGLNTGPLNLNVNNAASLSNVNVSTGISSNKISMLGCALAKTMVKTNNKTSILTGSLEICRTLGGDDR